MRGKLTDLNGKQFTNWTVLELSHVLPRKGAFWRCQCVCGTVRVVSAHNLVDDVSHGCGCTRRKTTTHGMTGSHEYNSWANMLGRCTNPGNEDYPLYGGRGISVCEEWKRFENFFRDLGERPAGTTLDRIDCNGNYEPSNVRWAPPIVQANNRRISKVFYFCGKLRPLTEICDMVQLKYLTVYKRLHRGWPLEKAVGLKSGEGGTGQFKKGHKVRGPRNTRGWTRAGTTLHMSQA